MALVVTPLIERLRTLANSFGYKPRRLPKRNEAPNGWIVLDGSNGIHGMHATYEEAARAASAVIYERLHTLPTCSGTCDCGWEPTYVYMQRVDAFVRMGFPPPVADGHLSDEQVVQYGLLSCSCPVCAPVDNCEAGYEEQTRAYYELHELFAREEHARIHAVWNDAWALHFEKNGHCSHQEDFRVHLVAEYVGRPFTTPTRQ